ncbi:MAG: class I SAM-dependent methyltransferase [Bacteroidia bacterium]
MAANYSNAAWFYDRLSRLIYGKALVQAQVYLLGFIPPDSRVLIVGGGTGWILEELTKFYPSGLKITYIEVAEEMMALSRKRNTGRNEVVFVTEAVENIDLIEGFDVVFTAFLFDNFTEENLEKIFSHIDNSLRMAGIWLNADFQLNGKWWQKVLLRSMLLFFRIVCGIEATKLPDIEQCFGRHAYKIIEQKDFFGRFTLSTVYRKAG